MIHCYIFNYGSKEIFHTMISTEIEDIDEYISKKFNWRIDEIFTMVSETPLTINEI